tara:strand:+ start:895 stop:2214 length:1320 start_codon:yes stop_codon:yes gene_type:complete
MEYNLIVNPISGKKVNLFGNLGRSIINNYISVVQQGGGCSGLRKGVCGNTNNCNWVIGKGCKTLSSSNVTKSIKKKTTSKNTNSKKTNSKKTNSKKTTSKKTTSKKTREPGCVEATKNNGFTQSQVKKYHSRPSPPYPAVKCAGQEMLGQGKESDTLYRSEPRGKSYAWVKVRNTEKKTRNTNKKTTSSECVEATKTNGFTQSQVKKYHSRSSPPYPAAKCAGQEMLGQGKESSTLYKSVPRGNRHVWVKVTSTKTYRGVKKANKDTKIGNIYHTYYLGNLIEDGYFDDAITKGFPDFNLDELKGEESVEGFIRGVDYGGPQIIPFTYIDAMVDKDMVAQYGGVPDELVETDSELWHEHKKLLKENDVILDHEIASSVSRNELLGFLVVKTSTDELGLLMFPMSPGDMDNGFSDGHTRNDKGQMIHPLTQEYIKINMAG